MAFIKVESEDLKIEEVFSIKQETEEQTDSSDDSQDDTDGGRKRKDGNKRKMCANKKRRMMGQPYFGMRRNEIVHMERRVLGPRCQSAACVKSSKHQCSTIAEADRENIFKCFWENMNWEEKKMYVRGLVDVVPIKRIRGSDNSKRSSSLVYFLNVNGQRRRTCKSMFLATLGIGDWCAVKWVQDAGNSKQNSATCQRREFMTSFLQDLPKVTSCYCRSSASKQYLEPGFQSMPELYKVYHRAAEEKMLRPLSKQVFSEEFKRQNLGLYHLKDQCNTCCSFKADNLPDNGWQVHLIKKEEPCAVKVEDNNDVCAKSEIKSEW